MMSAREGSYRVRSRGDDSRESSKSKWRAPSVDPFFPPLNGTSNKFKGNQRIQSAFHQRDKIPSPNRQTKSARSRIRTNAATYGSSSAPDSSHGFTSSRPRSHNRRRMETVRGKVVTVKQPIVPTIELPTSQAWSGEPLDYDVEVRKHGWKMEVPGDPFGLKARCISARLPYTERLIDPDKPILTERRPPQPRQNGTGTYFYNTIPRAQATVDIHPEFFSELVTAKRMELQNRQYIPVNA